MSYTIDFSGSAPEQKAVQAIEAAKAYLGDKFFAELIRILSEGIAAGKIENRRQVHLAMSFVGVQGFPVEAIIDKYWPSLPA